MSLEVNTRKVANIAILDLSGRMILGKHSGQVRDAVRELLLKGHKKILLNMEEVSYMDSAGLAELVSSLTSATGRGGSLKLLNVQKRVSELLRITRVASVFEVFSNETDALRSFES